MNNKQFTFKLLGVFLMEILNFSGTELRKTMWTAFLGIAFLKLIFVLVDLLPVFVK